MEPLLAQLPHINLVLNIAIVICMTAGFVAIKRGQRQAHPRWMMGAVGLGVLFLISYITQTITAGHSRFPGDDWVRTLFLIILLTHTVLAVIVTPLIPVVIVLAIKKKWVTHRKWARIIFPIWFYVAITGVIINWMVNHLRPH